MKLLSLASLAVLLLQLAVNPLQQQQGPQGSIEGTVTRAGTSQPVPNARVTLARRGGPQQAGLPAGIPVQAVPVQPNPAGARGAPPAPIAPLTTDDKGKFAFMGLSEGTYTLQIQANGYVVQPYGQRFPNGPGAPIALSAGQSMKDLNVSLTPAANISGRVRDTSDQPLINVPVQLLRYSYDSTGQRNYQSVGTTLTNDRGEYRMYWVTPGRYYLLAGRPTTGANALTALMMMDMAGGSNANGNEVPSVLGYAFYPGVTEIANARSIDLQPGADVQSIDLALTPKPRTYSIRGKVIDSRTGQPAARANVTVSTQTPGLSTDSNFVLVPSGLGQNYNAKTGIEIRDLLPGTYSVMATVQDLPVPGRGGPPSQATGMIPVTISASDVDGIVVSVVPAISIAGRLRVDGQLPASLTMDRFRVRLTPVGASSAAQQALRGTNQPPAQVGADGTFLLNNIAPGDYRIDVSGLPVTNPNAPVVVSTSAAGGFLKEARFENTDVLGSPLRVSGTSNNGLDIVMGIGGGRIDGTVTDLRSQPVAAMRVVIVPDRGRFRSDLYRTATTDPTGRFALASLAPGDYKVFSWESLEDNAWFDPDVIAKFEARGRAIHVTESSNESIDVKIIPAEGAR